MEAEGGGVVVVLHDLTLAAAVADNVILMHQGNIMVFGAKRHVVPARGDQHQHLLKLPCASIDPPVANYWLLPVEPDAGCQLGRIRATTALHHVTANVQSPRHPEWCRERLGCVSKLVNVEDAISE